MPRHVFEYICRFHWTASNSRRQHLTFRFKREINRNCSATSMKLKLSASEEVQKNNRQDMIVAGIRKSQSKNQNTNSCQLPWSKPGGFQQMFTIYPVGSVSPYSWFRFAFIYIVGHSARTPGSLKTGNQSLKCVTGKWWQNCFLTLLLTIWLCIEIDLSND